VCSFSLPSQCVHYRESRVIPRQESLKRHINTREFFVYHVFHANLVLPNLAHC
jgi:hypothetical protein